MRKPNESACKRHAAFAGWLDRLVRPVDPHDPLPPKTLAGSRGRVYGCSPGCLLLSLAVSILLTIFINVLIRLL